jgi:formyltetrahydrofolate-dependent phosphoribosylglycinamide formyltransferase
MSQARIVVLVSGNGSNLQALLDAAASGELGGDVVAVVSNRPGAYGLERAERAGVPAVAVAPEQDEPRRAYDARLAEVVAGFSPDLIVLAGWMRILTMGFLGRYPDKVVNLHPALPGELPGVRAIERAWDERARGERDVSGVMVHLVPDEGVDSGPVLATATIDMTAFTTLDDFERHVHHVEHRLLVEAVGTLCRQSTSTTEVSP